jgi:putative transposase
LRSVALNPVCARLVEGAEDWRWSSAGAPLTGQADGLTQLPPVLSRYPIFADVLAAETGESALARLRRAESIGRPLGDEAFLDDLERHTRRRPAIRGPKVRAEGGVSDSLFRAPSP